MRGLGTIINVGCILVGGGCGLLFGAAIKERMKETVLMITGIAVMVMALGGLFEKMLVIHEKGLSMQGTMMMICSLVLGAVIGELLDLDKWITRFGEWLKKKSGSEGDASFVGAFVSASCTVCIGAMAVVGSIEDGISGDYSMLLAKGVLDAIIICIMASTTGKGSIFSALSVGVFQGLITVIAIFAGGFLSAQALDNLSYVGNVLIFCVGLNISFHTGIRVINILPAIVIACAGTFLW